MRWSFENQLSERAGKDSTFIGIERSWTVLERAVPFAPGRTPMRYFQTDIRSGRIEGFSNDRCRIVHAHASTFLDIGRHDKDKTERQWWAQLYRRNTAIWLDFMGYLGKEVALSLQRITCHCDMHIPVVPFALTIMYGRERGQLPKGETPAERRVHMVQALVSSGAFRYLDDVEYEPYRSKNCNMLLILGLLRRK